ncbi:hypothetical protein Y1Q_0024400 [Alligator mississippiensis]|uniref:IRG-type G domain-containing protein n=1 Tax=Alligator mississippiensis TaxID=8496 RepID=A0A151MCE4_ALLMI|nr:hypothetical protein Y1Q_0024400 [Alligator mississippiensis]
MGKRRLEIRITKLCTWRVWVRSTSDRSWDCVKPKTDFCPLASPPDAAAMGNHQYQATASNSHGETEAGHKKWRQSLKVFQKTMNPFQASHCTVLAAIPAISLPESVPSGYWCHRFAGPWSPFFLEFWLTAPPLLKHRVKKEPCGVLCNSGPGPDFCPKHFLQLPQPWETASLKRLEISHADLAREIQRMKKKFYFVRAKVDQDLENERKTHGNTYSEGDTLQTIREDCRRQLEALGVSSPKVFLLSNWEIEKFDFHQLEDTLEQDLPHLKRLVLLLSLPNFSEEILKKKRAELKKLTFLIALASGGAGAIAIAVSSVSLKCNIQLLLVSTIAFYKHLGLDEESLSRTARWVNLPVDELRGVMRSPKIEDITFSFIVQAWIHTASYILGKSLGPIGMLAFTVCSFIITVFRFFQVVDELYADALRVRAKALGEENPGDSSGAVAQGRVGE